MIYKAGFKFRILRLLRILHWNTAGKGELSPNPWPTPVLFTPWPHSMRNPIYRYVDTTVIVQATLCPVVIAFTIQCYQLCPGLGLSIYDCPQ